MESRVALEVKTEPEGKILRETPDVIFSSGSR